MLAESECPDLCCWCPLLVPGPTLGLVLARAVSVSAPTRAPPSPHPHQSPLCWRPVNRDMDTHADNTIVEKEEEVSEQGQEDREDQVEDLQEHKERVIEEELGAEEDKVENNKIVDIESASEDDADDDIDNPQEDHDHQSESVKSEGRCHPDVRVTNVVHNRS